MPNFNFRFRLRLPEGYRLGAETPVLRIPPKDGTPGIILSSRNDKPIKGSADLVVQGQEYPTREAALAAGKRCLDALMLSLLRLGVGADFGGRRLSTAIITDVGLATFEQAAGKRYLRDEMGLTAFETDPSPIFIELSATDCFLDSTTRFEEFFAHALGHPPRWTTRDRLCLELYSASFFETTPHTRFLLLVAAVEALLERRPQSQAVRDHVQQLLSLTKGSTALSPGEKESLRDSLQSLVTESISRAGRRLASERLGQKEYLGRKAEDFFTHFYRLRCRLSHGAEDQPTLGEVVQVQGELRQFVADLLTATIPVAGT